MANLDEETAEISELNDQHWEERTLHLLQDSKIDQAFSEAKARKRGGRKHKVRWMKRPMAIPDVILELQEEEFRENALRCLSNFLIERREEDAENYHRTGFLLFNSCATMTILLQFNKVLGLLKQEVISFYWKMMDDTLNVRSSKRLVNVLTLFQCIAANSETRWKFVHAAIPNYLIPLIQSEGKDELFENLRAIALSVIGITCQTIEPRVIQWAVESNIVEACHTCIKIGNELSKVIAMHILEAVLRDRFGISYICDPMSELLLRGLMETWDDVVAVLSMNPDFSPRLLFHIIRCYVLLCAHDRGLSIVVESLPDPIIDNAFQDVTDEFPIIQNFRCQLLLSVGKSPEVLITKKQIQVEAIPFKLGNCVLGPVSSDVSPLKAIDLNKENCLPTPVAHYPVLVSAGKEN